jgi:hypothetical protein
MSLIILDSELQPITGPFVTEHNGFTGGQQEFVFYFKNQFPEFYYENIRLKVEMADLELGSIFSESGWSVKLKFGSEQPTEKEWGDVIVNNEITLPVDIGSSEVANTESLFPVWVRVFCPGHTDPQYKTDINLSLKYFKKLVDGVI